MPTATERIASLLRDEIQHLQGVLAMVEQGPGKKRATKKSARGVRASSAAVTLPGGSATGTKGVRAGWSPERRARFNSKQAKKSTGKKTVS